MAFFQDRTREATHAHVALGGRLDLAGVAKVERAFAFAATARRLPVLLDMSETTFIGSLGAGMIVAAAKALARQGQKLVIVRPTAMVRETLEAASLLEILPVADDEEHALALLLA